MRRSHAAVRAPGRAVVIVIAAAALIVSAAAGAAAALAESSPSPAGGALTDGGWSDLTWYIVGAVVAFVGAAIVVWLKRRGRAGEE
jgi:cytochrome bd-type quinol oxidase subunit 2